MGDIVLDREMLNKPKEKYWISYIKQRIKKNKNFLGFVSGQTGSGKSWSSLSICEQLDPQFNIDRVVFSGLELMNLINSGKLQRGSAICFEEVGIEMNNKNWASVTNKMLNFLIQSFRHRGFVLIMNSPYMDFVDSSTRKLFHAEMQTIGIDFNLKEGKLKPQLIQYNSRLQKFYYKRLKVMTFGGTVPVDVWRVAKPSDELIKAYEQKKKEYTDTLNKRIYEELQEVHNKREQKNRKALTEIQEEIVDSLRQGLTIEAISRERNRTQDVIRKSIQLIKGKGYVIKPLYEGNRVIRYDVTDPQAIQGTEAR